MADAKLLEMRKLMHENNQDINEFLFDIDQWKSRVEMKRSKLLSEAVRSNDDLPLVRNSLLKRKKKQNQKNKNANNLQRIKSFDYKAWDTFDFDKALEDVDNSNVKICSDESETDDEWESERRVLLSNEEKEQGNIRFREGKIEDAIEHYTTAIQLTPENALLYTNRALALLKLERFASAEADCSAALHINPLLVKALYRRALARTALEKYGEAVTDLRRILDIEPKNAAALKDLNALTGDSNTCGSAVDLIFKLTDPELLASNDLQRISIVEAGSPYDVNQPSLKTSFDAAGTAISTPVSALGSSNKVSSSGLNFEPKQTTSTLKPDPPTNWLQMERDLRDLVPSGLTLSSFAVDYLCSIEPANYKMIIGQNLDSSCLGRLLSAIYQSSTLSSVEKGERMLALSKLPRFDVAWMLAEDADRKIVECLFCELKLDPLDPIKGAFT